MDYANMTDDDFDRILNDIIDRSSASQLLLIPGVYELVREANNNAVLTQWEKEQDND